MARILIVEDDLALAMIITDSLCAEEHQVEHAATGLAAKGRIGAGSFDLIILDWDLPGASGYEILKYYRSEGGKTPVIMLTGRSSFQEKELALDSGADDYLTKPFAMRELRARVRAVLRRAGAPSAEAREAEPPRAASVSTSPLPQPGSLMQTNRTISDEAASANSPPQKAQPDLPVPLRQGMLIEGKYQLEEKLRQSHAAVIWLARQTALGRPVVLKFLSPALLSDANATERFIQEYRVLARVSHPAVISLLEVGNLSGAPFLVMEYAKGRTLREIIQKHGQAPVSIALAVLTQLCAGMQVAHEAGIVHRDLRPDNIIIGNLADHPPLLKIIDFGLCYLEGARARLTKEGIVLGSCEYMAPEQFEEGIVDRRSDVYALGLILYEMLTGRLPFEAKTPQALIIKKATEKPQSVSLFRTDIPEGSALNAILTRALQKDKDLRYQSAAHLKTDIMNILSVR